MVSEFQNFLSFFSVWDKIKRVVSEFQKKCWLAFAREEADLFGASGRLVGGVEVDHHRLALELVQRHGPPVLVLEGEVGRHAALGHLHASRPRLTNRHESTAIPGVSRAIKLRAYLAADDARGRARAAPPRGRRGGRGRPEAVERGGGGRAEERLRTGRRAARRRPGRHQQRGIAAGRGGRECHGGWSFR
jgi:hypothetical protein